MKLSGVGKLRWQEGQAIVSQGQHVQVGTASNLSWKGCQPVPIHIQVCQLGQLAEGLWQGLGRR